MLYEEYFPRDYGVPRQIIQMVKGNLLSDMSWKADKSPSFGAMLKDGNFLRVWVEHPNKSKRKGSPYRYSVYIQEDISRPPHETIALTDDLEEALFHIDNVLERRGRPTGFRLLGRR